MEYVKEISLPIDKPYNRVPVFAKQGDYNSRFLHVTLTENDEAIATSAIGTVTRVAVGVARRKDRGSKCFAATYNNDGTFTLPLPAYATEYANDDVTLDLMVWTVVGEETQLLRSAAVVVHVEKSGYSGEEVSDDENRDILSQLIAEVQELNTTVITAEAGRVEAEQERVTAETARVNAEQQRASAETARANAESSRASAESGRVTAEQGRVTAEQQRVAAEQQRATDYAALQEELGDSIENINSAAEAAETVQEIAASIELPLYYDEEGYVCADYDFAAGNTTNNNS